METNDKERERGGFFDIVAGELANYIIRKIHVDRDGSGQIDGYIRFRGDRVIFTVFYWISLDFELSATSWGFEVTFQGVYQEFEEETEQFLVDVVNDYIPLKGIGGFDKSCLKEDTSDIHIIYSI